ncbi:MAG: hypothetical protein LBG20_04475, partial [Holosporaceae bacterium]|nr:hypothetical protein [Holosporaceae bacterium]
MTRIRANLSTFYLGYLNERSRGNVDMEQYNFSLSQLHNMYQKVTGGLFKRLGTHAIAAVQPEVYYPEYQKTFPYTVGNKKFLCLLYVRTNSHQKEFFSIKFYTMNGVLTDNNGQEIVLDVLEIPHNLDIKSTFNNISTFQAASTLFVVSPPNDVETWPQLSSIKPKEDDNVNPFEIKPVDFSFLPLGPQFPYALQPARDGGKVQDGNFFLEAYSNKSSFSITTDTEDQKSTITFTYVYLTETEAKDFASQFLNRLVMLSYSAKNDDEPDLTWCVKVTDTTLVAVDEQSYYVKLNCTALPDLCPQAAEGGVQPLPTYVENAAAKDPSQNRILVTRWYSSICILDHASKGMPTMFELHDNRLFASGSAEAPAYLWGSSRSKNDWFDFSTGPKPGDSVREKLSLKWAEHINWMISGSNLFIGTDEGIFMVGSGPFNDETITPANFYFKNIGRTCACSVLPAAGPDNVFFVDSSERSLCEIAFTSDNQYKINELSMLSDDLMQNKIIKIAYVHSPNKLIFCLLEDGTLCSMSCLKNNNIFSWASHSIGGVGRIVDIHSTPDVNGDILWLTTRRHLEDLEKEVLCLEYIKDQRNPEENFYVDFGREYEILRTINTMSANLPWMLTSSIRLSTDSAINCICMLDPEREHFVSGVFALDHCSLEYVKEENNLFYYEVKDRWGTRVNDINDMLENNTYEDVQMFVEAKLKRIVVDPHTQEVVVEIEATDPNFTGVALFTDTFLVTHDYFFVDYNSQPSEKMSMEDGRPTYVNAAYYLEPVEPSKYKVYTDSDRSKPLRLAEKQTTYGRGKIFIQLPQSATLNVLGAPYPKSSSDASIMTNENMRLDYLADSLHITWFRLDKFPLLPDLANKKYAAFSKWSIINIVYICEIKKDAYGHDRYCT